VHIFSQKSHEIQIFKFSLIMHGSLLNEEILFS